MLLILFPYKFTKFYEYLLGVDEFKLETGFQVEVHDLSALINRGWEKSFLSKTSKNCLKFHSLGKWKKRFYKLKKNKNLVIFNFLDFNTFNSLVVHYYLRKSKAKILRLASSGVLEIDYYQKKKNLSHIIDKLISTFTLGKLFYFLQNKIIIFLYKNFFILNEIILISGNKNQLLSNKGNKVGELSFHSLDFNKTLRLENLKKKFIVFFDTPTPYFLDDFETMYNYSFKKRKISDIQEHYKKLNHFLKSIEKTYSQKVIIVPHPKVRDIKNPFYDKSFYIDKSVDAAAKLICESKFIICAAPSTVITYAIATYRPILILTGHGFKNNKQSIKTNKFGTEMMSNFLSCKTLDYETTITKKIKMSVNRKKYDQYKYQYLTSKKISKTSNCKIIYNFLKK